MNTPRVAGTAIHRADREQCIHMLSVTERAVYGASMSAVPQLSLNPKIVGLLTLKRPEGRAPTSRQLVDAPCTYGPTGRPSPNSRVFLKQPW